MCVIVSPRSILVSGIEGSDYARRNGNGGDGGNRNGGDGGNGFNTEKRSNGGEPISGVGLARVRIRAVASLLYSDRLWRHGSEPAGELFGDRVSRKEALNLQLLQRDVSGRAERGDHREKCQGQIVLAQVHADQRRHGDRRV